MPAASTMDRYQVQEYLAEGGMGAIYRGRQVGARGEVREVVLKQLLPEFTQNQEFIDLFVREAKLSASLDHPNIIRTTDLVTAGADYFIVMEYLYGADLRTLLRRAKRRGQRLAPAAALAIAREVLRALAYAHAARGPTGAPLGLIHRDVSPSNILVSARGEVKLTDFGIAKATTHDSGLFYRVKGKVGYMSPEQAKSEPMDRRSDLFAVGVCLHEALTGERLYVATGITQSAEELFSQPIPSASRRVAGVPVEVDDVLARALALAPARRYRDADEFGEAVDEVAARHGLAMTAAQLADHLRAICGPPATWRDEDHETANVRGGTAILEPEGLPEDLDAELAEPSVMTQQGIVPPRRRRKEASIPALGRLQRLELTSIIPLSATDQLGAQPLVDLDDLGSGRGIDGALASLEEQATPPPVVRGDESVVVVRPTAPPRGEAAARSADPPKDRPAAPRGAALRTLGGILLLLALGAGVAAAIGLTGPRLEVPTTPP